MKLLSSVAFLLVSLELVEGSTFTDLGFYNFWSSAGMPTQTVEAMTAPSQLTLYVASSWVDAGQLYSQICKWTSSGGWSQVANSTMRGSVTALAILGNDLYIAGSFDSIGTQSAANLARLNVSNGSLNASSSGLSLSGTVNLIKFGSWGGGTNGGRTYIYLGGAFSELNGNTCSCVARMYNNGTAWITETMNGGLSSGTGVEIFGMDINTSYYSDQYNGYRHLVYLSGQFNVTANNTHATNMVTWNELYSGSNPWFQVGTSGAGVSYWSSADFCVKQDLWNYGHVLAQAYSGTNVYYAGSFNRINTSIAYEDDSGSCPFWYPIGLAQLASFTPGLWGSRAIYSFDGYTELEYARMAQSGSNVYLATGDGSMICSAGSYPGATIVAAAWRYSGGSWTAIGNTSTAGNPAPLPIYDVVQGGSSSAYFLTTDGTHDVIKKYVP